MDSWEEIATRRIENELGAVTFINLAWDEIDTYFLRKKAIDSGIGYKEALLEFENLQKALSIAAAAFDEIGEGNLNLFTGIYSDVIKLDSTKRRSPTSSAQRVRTRLEKLRQDVTDWSHAIDTLCAKLKHGDEFKRQGKHGKLKTFPQHYLAYRIRAIYQETFHLPSLPRQDDTIFTPILEALLDSLKLDSNMSRVYRLSDPRET